MKKNEVSVYLESIENKYNIKLPSIFWKKSDSDEMLWLTKSYDWIRDNISELIISKSCFFSSLGDCEFIPFMYYDERVSELYESINYDIKLKEEDFCINPNYKLIPFAFMASGDVYCFLYTHKDNKEDDDPLIIVYGHDTGDFYVWANNFEEFLFWQIVSELTDYEGDIQSEQIQYNISLLSKEYVEQLKYPIQELIEKIPKPKLVDIFVLNKRK